MNEHIPRWIRASVAKYFDDALIDRLPIFMEGMERNQQGTEFCEIRMDGPNYQQYSRHRWKLTIDLNVLIQAVFDDHDMYKIDRETGIIVSVFPKTFNVYRYGDGLEDTNDYLGCFQIKNLGGEDVVVVQFGKIASDTNLMQSTVGAHYEMWLQLLT